MLSPRPSARNRWISSNSHGRDAPITAAPDVTLCNQASRFVTALAGAPASRKLGGPSLIVFVETPMQTYSTPLSLYDVVYVIIPRLHQAQKLVNQTLDSLINGAVAGADLTKRLEQRRQFTLELQVINTNLEHLLERYRGEVKSLLQSHGSRGNVPITPDEMEHDAVEHAKEIYRKVVAFQTGRRDVPF
jgi:hypothetical protein